MSGIELLCVVLGVAIGSVMGNYIARRKTVIKYSVKHIFFLLPIICLFASYTTSFAFECIVCEIVMKLIPTDNWFWMVIHSIFENGLLIPVLSYLLSRLFERLVEVYDLCDLERHSNLTFKICFTVMTVLISVLVLCVIRNDSASNSDEAMYFINRVSMWIITSFGLWIGIYRSKETTKRKRKPGIQLNTMALKERIKYLFSVIFGLAVCALVEWVVINETFEGVNDRYILFLILSIALSVIVSEVVSIGIYRPSLEKSIEILGSLISNYSGGTTEIKRFGRMRYCIDNGYLVIEETDVSYPGHEKDSEFISLFRRKEEFVIKDGQSASAIEFMTKKYNNQNKYIRESFDKCKSEYKKKIR